MRRYGTAFFLMLLALFVLLGQPAQTGQAMTARQETAPPAPTTTGEAPPPTQTPTTLPITLALTDGQVLQGEVSIRGMTAVPGFQSYELSFAYSDAPSPTWFLLAEGRSAVDDASLATWDTNILSDGDYDLRLAVTLADGSQQTVVVQRLRVRNTVAIETDTPVPAPPTPVPPTPEPPTPLPPTPTHTPQPTAAPATPPPAPPTATPMQPNPAELSSTEVWESLLKGITGAIGAFALLGIYSTGKAIRRRNRR